MPKTRSLVLRVLYAVVAFVFLMAAPLWFLPAKAEVPTSNSLKVYAQYWGDPDSAVLLGEYSREQLDALSYGEYGYEGYYGNINTFNNVLRIHARKAQQLNEVLYVANVGYVAYGHLFGSEQCGTDNLQGLVLRALWLYRSAQWVSPFNNKCCHYFKSKV